LADRDGAFVVRTEAGQVTYDGSVELEAAALDQLHDGGGRGDDLGE
jgi:hypothetical protein